MSSSQDAQSIQDQDLERLHQHVSYLEQQVEALTQELHRIKHTPHQQQLEDTSLYHQIFDHLPVAVVIFNKDGDVVAMNHQNEALINTPRDSLIGTFNMFQDQEAQDRGYVEYFCRAFQGEVCRMPPTPYNVQRAGLCGREEEPVVWTETTYFPLSNSNGTIEYVGEVNQDVTRRIQVEQELRQNEEQLRTVIQTMPVMVNAFDEHGTIIVWNDECTRVTGYTSQEIVGNPQAMDMLYPNKAYHNTTQDIWNKLGNNYRDWEWTITCKDQSTRIVAWSNTSGQVPIPGWTTWGIGVDITDRKRTEQDLRRAHDELEARVEERTAELTTSNTRLHAEIAERERIEHALRISEERYERAVNAANVGVWDWDLKTNDIYLSPNLKNMLGYQNHEIRNHLDDWGQRVYPDDRELVMAAAIAHLNGKTPVYEVEHRMLHKDGSIRWFNVRGIVVRDEHGNPVRMSGTDSDITDRKHMEDSLRTSEERYRLISELISDYAYAFRIEPDGSYSPEWMISEAFTRVTGFTREEIMSVHIHQNIVYHDDTPLVRKHQKRLLAGHTDIIEFRIVTRDNEIRWIRDHAQPVWNDEHSQVVRIYGAANDITERKQTEEALRESEERYRSIITTMHEGVVLHDQYGAIREWNNRAKHMLGRTTEKLLGHTSVVDSNWQAIHEDGTPFDGINHPSLVALHTGQPCSNVVMGIYKPDGTLTWILINAQPMFRNQTSSPWGVVTTFTDITELKQAQEALTRAYTDLEALNTELGRRRDLLRTLFDGLQDGLVLLDKHGYILAINQAIAHILGHDPDALVNKSWISMCQETCPPFPIKLVTQTLEQGKPHRRRERYAGPDPHSPRVLDIQTLPIIGAEQTLDQVVVHIVDVTEQLTLEAIAIQHERLAASGALAATVAHEINTPLQSINHCLFLAYDLTDPHRDSYLTMARDEIARISKIVRQLLDLHRPTSSTPASFAINPLCERVLTLISGSLTRQQITVVRDMAPDLPLLHGHADQVTQVIMNLIMNAKNAMKDGGTLHVRTWLQNGEETMSDSSRSPGGAASDTNTNQTKAVILQIEDTGTGMSPDVQARIFDSFFTTSPSGMGLGLTISQKIIKHHGGHITLQSNPGQGSRFTVLLPLTQERQGENEEIP